MDKELNLPYYNTTNFPLAVKEQLGKIPFTEDDEKKLKYHQFIVKEFFTRNRYQRGLLIAHSMGQGKTRLAVAIADYYRRMDKRRKVIVLLSKSLEGNFKNTIREYTRHDDAYIDTNYKFISLNASNMFKQVSNADKTKEEADYEKRLGDFMNDLNRDSSLNDSLLIIDEAHNLFNAVTNGAKNATNLYDLIMKSTNLKLIFLTGTPIINDPFELVPCFNMLRGNIVVDTVARTTHEGTANGGMDDDNDDAANENDNADNTANPTQGETIDDLQYEHGDDTANNLADEIQIDYQQEDSHPNHDHRDINRDHQARNRDNNHHRDTDNNHRSNHKPRDKKGFKSRSKTPSDTTTLFSEMYEEFEEFFIGREEKTIKNKDKFTNRIYGLVSYYGDLYFPNEGDKEGFPKKLPTIIEKVPMSEVQFARYVFARDQELEETRRSFKSKESRFSSSSGGSSTYRVKTRQISNYCIPEYALGPVRGAKAREKFIHKITVDDLHNTATYSPKLGKILENINKHSGTPGMVYSQFVSGEGIAIFARILDVHNYKNFSSEDDSGADVFDIKEKKQKVYAILSGDIDPEERQNIIKQFNLPENKDGSIISVLLLSGAVAEGIDLKRIRHVHIMESFWNYARINQVETRAIRYLSHTDLPLEQQNVQTYIYLSDYPLHHPKNKIFEPTTDIDLYNKSINNMKIINEFLLAIAESSVDCGVHYGRLPAHVQQNIHCKMCAPTNDQLFHPLINKDMTLPNSCKPYSEKKVTAKEIKLTSTGEKFYYKKSSSGEVDLYHFNKKLQGYTPMPRNHPHYAELIEKVMETI